ncbi:bifunctional aminoglycoside phosphotransferase/ATP-binding protein [Pseudonocardia spirodelae]|uniref:AAA family ATPase n=1 Tax=Pseudonocardia spirodelae TaxID=3133431 RepID=A0ABU8T2J3_9PSEU
MGTGAAAEVRETHTGLVVLAGDHAYKVKKAVRTPYCDFSTRELRVRALARELERNRRFAPDVYLGVGGYRGPGGPDGEPVLVMRRMPAGSDLATVLRDAAPGTVRTVLDRVARAVADAHAAAPPGAADRAGPDAVAARWAANLDELAELTGDDAVRARTAPLRRLATRFLAGRAALFAARADRVVDGHGDLLATDVYVLPDGVRLLDCLDFDDDLRQVDPLDDVACLATDLELRGPDGAAGLLVAAYRRITGDPAPDALTHHFLAYRAVMRAKVAALRARQGAAGASAEADALSAQGLDHLRTGAVRLALVGGPPGSGKTTLARALAAATGATVLSSDVVRRELAGPGAGPAPAPFGTGRYAPGPVREVYDELLRRAGALLALGESVVLDASWTAADLRRAAAGTAAAGHAPLVPLRCAVAPRVAAARIAARTGSDSDADAGVAARMRAATDPWPEAVRVDTGAACGDALATALAAWAAAAGR